MQKARICLPSRRWMLPRLLRLQRNSMDWESGKKPAKMRMEQWASFIRLQNNVIFVPDAATEYFERKTGGIEYVTRRSAYTAERVLPKLLDAVRDQTLFKRERKEAVRAMRKVKRRKRTRARVALSLTSSSSDDDDEGSEYGRVPAERRSTCASNEVGETLSTS